MKQDYLTVFLILVILSVSDVEAFTLKASVSASVVSTTNASIDAASELLKSAKDAVSDGMTLTSTGVRGNTIVFSTTDTAPLTALVTALASSGGTVGVNGTLSTGQGVSLTITHAIDNGSGKGTVHAIVAYD